MPRSLTVSVLGPLEVRVEGRPVSIGGAKPRAVLGLLALYGDSVVPGATLIEVLWGDDPPRTAGKALQTHVSALRRALGEGFVLTKGAGWMLAEADTDAARFTAAADAGRKAARAGNPSGAVAAFTEAIDSWRGAPELPDTPRAASEVTRWVELRETVADDRIAAALAGGSDAELVSELESAVAHAPLRERRWGQLMLALYRAGRQADALAAYRRARALLDEQLGVEPGPDLRALERAILGHDPALAAPKAVATAARPRMPVRSALPVQRTTFVGRQDELRRVDELLRGHSLVTVTGPGGVGKTRLAVAAAQAAARLFRGGVAFVDLVPVSPEFVVPAVASALGVTEQPPQDLAGTVRERLARGRWLVVLDNCEHVLEAVGALAEELTAGCPELAILATSRERLGVPGERVIAVPGLELPVPGTGDPRGSAAVTLFVDRARAVDRGFDPDRTAVAEVCARLDGIPLAIELAAARCASLGIDGVRAGLNDRMQLLTGARGTERHRSLRAVLDWSHDLLDDAERVAFRRLSVFADGFDLSAAIAVASETTDGDDAVLMADLVGRLADKNLLTRVRARVGSRWRMLEIIRVYGRELLAASGEEPRVRSRHLRWAADSAERIEARLTAAEPWREEFDAVADDLRAALSTVASGAGHSAPAAVLAWALGHLSYAADYLAGARAHYRLAAAASGSTAVAALRAAAGVAFAQMRSDLAFDLLLEAGDRAAEAGDRPAEAASLASAVVLGARCPGSFPQAPSGERLNRLLSRARAAADGSAQVEAHIAAAAAWTASPVRARCDGPLGEIALAAARRLDDPVLISAALDGVTTVALGEGRFRDAARLARGRLNLLERFTRHDPHAGGEIKDIFHMVTETAIAAGDLPCALATATRARQDTIAAGQAVPMLASSRLVLTHALCGAFVEAVEEAAEMHAAWDRAGRPPASWMAPAAYATALACGLTGDPEGRRLWTARARDLTEDRMVQGFAPFVDCRIALYTGDIDTAVGIAETLPPEYMGKFDAYARTIAAECAVVAGLGDAALRLDAVVPAARENDWATACTARARGRLTGERGLLDDAVAGWERITARFEWACTLLLVDDQAPEGAAVLAGLGCPIPGGRDVTAGETALFVGRQGELVRLTGTLSAAAASEPQVVVVSGDAGIGKTRLLGEVVRGLDGWLVAEGHCVEAGTTGLPYAPLSGLLGAVAATRPGARLLDAAARDSPGLLPLLGGGNPVDTTSGLAQLKLFDALVRLLGALADERPTLAVIEDLHWADQSTRAFLSFLCRNLPPKRVAVLVTARTDELHRTHPLRPLLAELTRLPAVTAVELGPLRAAELARVLAEQHGAPVPRDVAAAIARRSGGNPLFAEQLWEAGAADAGTRLPVQLADVLLHRVDRLSPVAQRLLRAMSLAGGRIEYDALTRVADLEPGVLASALRECADARLLEPVAGSDAFEFRHALLAEVIAADIVPTERRALHEQYADALAGTAPAAEVARHCLGAADLAGAFAWSLDAAAEAAAVAAPNDALGHWERVIELWPHATVGDLARAGELSSVARQAAAAADQAGDPARAAELARLALAEAGTPEQRAQAGITLAPLLTPLVTGLEDQEVTVAEAALADAAGEAELTARARFVLGRALLLAGRFAEAVPVADQAAAQARELGMADESLGARATAYFARRQLGEQDAAEEAALTAAATGGESVETALWVLTRMADWWWPADPARGEPIALAAHTLAVDQGVRASIRGAWARETLTLCRWLTGHWDDVDELAATDPLAVNDPTAGAVALECEVDIARGRLDLARRRLQLAEKVTTDALSRTFVAIVTADLCLAERDPATAAALCLAGIADPPPETGFADFETILVSRAVAALADARDAGDDVERAAAVLAAADRVEQRLAERPNPRLSAIPQSALRAHGSRLDGGGDPDLWRQAIELRTGQPYEIAKCRYQLAKALLAAGDTATADRELDLAADACRELGAVVLLDRITALR